MATPAHTFSTPERPLTWLITGCSSGIGLSLARQVLASGHRLIATSRNPARTPDLVREVEAHGNGSRWLALDVDDGAAAARLVQQLEAGGDGGDDGDDDGAAVAIDVLVNNAGFAILQTVEQAREDEVRALMETLVFGPLRLTQAVLPHMRRRRFGVVVYISTGAALEARPSMGLYGAAKAAGDALVKTLAKEVAPFNVRALAVSLGAFRTNMAAAVRRGAAPLDPDYRGGAADQIMQSMAAAGDAASSSAASSAAAAGQGDPDKAARAIVALVTAQGAVGRGREAETLLPLGKDAAVRVREVRDKLDHALAVFGDVCNSVQCD